MNKPEIEFQPFQKISRLRRDIIITEKIDGTNSCVYIPDYGDTIHAASRTRWITPEDDNYGFARWVEANQDELKKLGPGMHFGEWWGAGVQRRYNMTQKKFSLFNVGRWSDPATRPACVDVVPLLYKGTFSMDAVNEVLDLLKRKGSVASPGFMDPEGIVVYHPASKELFKVTCKNDESHKSELVVSA